MTWTPRLVALDIDGTLLIPDLEHGFSTEVVTAPVTAAVLDAVRAGAHVVLASGRAPLSMAGVADRLGLTRLVEELTGNQLHIVASNGSVVVRHAPMEMVHEVTFDAADPGALCELDDAHRNRTPGQNFQRIIQ